MNHTKDARRIGLVDVNGQNGFPNLALMRISAWHKARGDTVEWWDGMLSYDRIYMSKVFTFSPDNDTVMQADEIIKGGTGSRDGRRSSVRTAGRSFFWTIMCWRTSTVCNR